MNSKEKLQKIINLKKDILSFTLGKEEKEAGVFLGKNVFIEPNVFFDTSGGPIVIGDETKINAGAVLRGPLLVGSVCKIGGEIEHSIIENYSNKQHYGYVGYSYIGAWVNIGGGTSIATLKNTYGSIKMENTDTRQKFLGAILGDFVKTSINTSIFPGKIIGPGAHLYGMVTEDVPPFTSHVSPGNLYELPIDIILDAQKAMMARRDIVMTMGDELKMKELFENTQKDRDEAGVKKEKLRFK